MPKCLVQSSRYLFGQEFLEELSGKTERKNFRIILMVRTFLLLVGRGMQHWHRRSTCGEHHPYEYQQSRRQL